MRFYIRSLILSAGQGPEDVIAEYYQQQVEMLEGFNEMDALTDRGFLPGMSKVWSINLMLVTLGNTSYIKVKRNLSTCRKSVNRLLGVKR